MNEIARLILIVGPLLLSGAAEAQTFKCRDAAGKITYSNINCKEQGLKDAGEVRDRINVNPNFQPPAPNSSSRGSEVRNRPQQSPARAAAPEASRSDTPAPDEPAKPERRCFTVQTPKGAVTRCNDKPEE